VGSTAWQIGTEWRVEHFFENGAPGGITRRCAPRPCGVALKGDRRRFATSSNPAFYVVGSTAWQIGTEWRVEHFF